MVRKLLFLFAVLLFLAVSWTPFFCSPETCPVWYGAWHLTCHQIRHRSFCLSEGTVLPCGPGIKFPVCQRCYGIYLGFLAGTTLGVSASPVTALTLLPMAVDGTGQLLGLWESTADARLTTGFVAGLGGGMVAAALFSDGKVRRPKDRQSKVSDPDTPRRLPKEEG